MAGGTINRHLAALSGLNSAKDFNNTVNGLIAPNQGLPNRGQRGADDNIVRLHPDDAARIDRMVASNERLVHFASDTADTNRQMANYRPPNHTVLVPRGRQPA